MAVIGKAAVAIALSAAEPGELQSLARAQKTGQAMARRARIVLAYEPRAGTPRKIGDDEIADTSRKTLETTPPGSTHWSLRSMAKTVGYAPSTIHRIWRAFVCVDEKLQIQAVDRSQPLLPMRPGQVELRTHDDTRHGTTSLFATLDIASGSYLSTPASSLIRSTTATLARCRLTKSQIPASGVPCSGPYALTRVHPS